MAVPGSREAGERRVGSATPLKIDERVHFHKCNGTGQGPIKKGCSGYKQPTGGSGLKGPRAAEVVEI